MKKTLHLIGGFAGIFLFETLFFWEIDRNNPISLYLLFPLFFACLLLYENL